MSKKVVFLLPFLILLSCSVQKRKYQKGYYVNWKHQSQTEKTVDVAKTTTPKPAAKTNKTAIAPTEQREVLLAALQNENTISLAKSEKKPSVFKKDEPCDELVFKDGTELKAKIIEINTTEIKYKKCDLPEGPLYVARKSEVFMIKYANGTREVFKNDVAESQNTPVKKKQVNPANQRTHPLAILSIVFGVIGLYPVLFLFSIAAIIMANYAIKKIHEEPENYKGEVAAQVGKVLGIIGAIVGAILVIFLFFILLALF